MSESFSNYEASLEYTLPLEQNNEPIQMVEGELVDKVIAKKFFIFGKLQKDNHEYSEHIYYCIDLKSEIKRNLVIKMSNSKIDVSKEMYFIQKVQNNYVPDLISRGVFQVSDPTPEQKDMGSSPTNSSSSSKFSFGIGKFIKSYFVMQRFGPSLKTLIENINGGVLPQKDVIQLGIKILRALETIHDQGVIYNNLSLDHILVGDDMFSPESRSEIALIDFSNAREYRDSDGNIIRSDGGIYKNPEKIQRLYQRSTDIEDLQELIASLGVVVNIKVMMEETPDYMTIKQILEVKLQSLGYQLDDKFIWSIYISGQPSIDSAPKVKEIEDKFESSGHQKQMNNDDEEEELNLLKNLDFSDEDEDGDQNHVGFAFKNSKLISEQN